MQRKKKLLSFVCLLLFVFLLTGCGSTKEKKNVQSVDDLTGAVIGVQLGTTGDIFASDYEEDGVTTVERYNKANDAVQALKQGKIDCVIIDEQPAKAYIANSPELSILDEAFAVEDYAVCVSKENPELKAAINEALQQLKQEGTLAQIVSSYIDAESGAEKYVSPETAEYPNGKLVMATNATFPPYESYLNGQVVGIDVDMMRAVCDKLGRQLVIEDMEFDAIINAVQSGKADVGVAGMTVTEERLLSIDFTDSYATSTQVIIIHNGSAAASKSLAESLYNNFVKEDRWKYLAAGLGNTLLIALCAVIVGLIIGFFVAIVRSSHDKAGTLPILNLICKCYLTIVRGTPVMVQLLIIYYVVFASSSINKVIVAIIAFGFNSGAYVAEIIRGGIMSVDNGQFEAGRSLGLNYPMTMRCIILPQAIKNVLPSLLNEFISLLKETSICGYIGLTDLTRGGDIIRSITFEALLPLLAVAVIYLILVMLLTAAVGRLERRLRSNERR